MNKVDLDIRGSVAHITLQRPHKLNAIDPDMLDGLESAAAALERSTSVRVAVLAGAGARAFCVGADIRAWAALEPLDMWRQWIHDGHRVMNRLSELRMPLIASIGGFAFGGGLELALAADIRIAADTATFAMPEVSIATVPGWGGTARLAAVIGIPRAKEMIFSARRIDAATAERWGLVNRLAPTDELEASVDALARQISAQAPVAVQMAKQCIDGGTPEALAGALAASLEDAREGLASFEERRKANYAGR